MRAIFINNLNVTSYPRLNPLYSFSSKNLTGQAVNGYQGQTHRAKGMALQYALPACPSISTGIYPGEIRCAFAIANFTGQAGQA